jgi:hypothetical protein
LVFFRRRVSSSLRRCRCGHRSDRPCGSNVETGIRFLFCREAKSNTLFSEPYSRSLLPAQNSNCWGRRLRSDLGLLRSSSTFGLGLVMKTTCNIVVVGVSSSIRHCRWGHRCNRRRLLDVETGIRFLCSHKAKSNTLKYETYSRSLLRAQHSYCLGVVVPVVVYPLLSSLRFCRRSYL